MRLRIAWRFVVPLMLLAAMPCTVARAQAVDMEVKPPPPPVTFARGGQEMRVWLHPFGWPHPGLAKLNVVLSAFGRTWSKPASVAVTSASASADMAVPKVRVPTVFSIIVDENRERRIVGELVAYPDRDVAWDEKIVLYSCGAPSWFDQWATATGLPLKTITPAGLPTAELGQVGEDTQTLLILSPNATGRRDPVHVVKLANEKAVNILFLDFFTEWFSKGGGDSASPVAVGGGQMRRDLLAITGKQTWAGALEFRSRRQPCGMIANRWAWIADRDSLPLVEAVAVAGSPPAAMRPVVLSYLPWAEQLGRREEADELLRATLVAAAEASLSNVAWRSLNFVHPKRDRIDRKDRPVLAAAASTLVAFKDLPWAAYVLDVRGTDRLPEGLREELKALERRIGADADSLVILGDDPMLDEWEWLKLDRAKKQIGAAGVQWLPDDGLPPSKESQIRLMLALTELGVPLAPPDQEEERK